MTGKTHLLAGLISGLVLSEITISALNNAALITGDSALDTLILVAACCIGSLAPDIDHPHSMINGIIPFFRWTNLITGHRGILHSGLIPLILISTYFTQAPLEWILSISSAVTGAELVLPAWIIPFLYALGVGWLSHLILDALTPRGIPLFYPYSKSIRFLPRFLSITTGSCLEFIFLLGLWAVLALFVLVIYVSDFMSYSL